MASNNSDKGGSTAAVLATPTTTGAPPVDSLAAVETNLRNVTLGDNLAATQYTAALSTHGPSKEAEAASASAPQKKTKDKIDSAISSSESISSASVLSSPLTSSSSGSARVQAHRSSSERESDLIKRRVFVGNLDHVCTENDVVGALEHNDGPGKHGRIMEVRIVRDHTTHESKGYGFVLMESQEQAKAIIDYYKEGSGHSLAVRGRAVNIRSARRREPATGMFGDSSPGRRHSGRDWKRNIGGKQNGFMHSLPVNPPPYYSEELDMMMQQLPTSPTHQPQHMPTFPTHQPHPPSMRQNHYYGGFGSPAQSVMYSAPGGYGGFGGMPTYGMMPGAMMPDGMQQAYVPGSFSTPASPSQLYGMRAAPTGTGMNMANAGNMAQYAVAPQAGAQPMTLAGGGSMQSMPMYGAYNAMNNGTWTPHTPGFAPLMQHMPYDSEGAPFNVAASAVVLPTEPLADGTLAKNAMARGSHVNDSGRSSQPSTPTVK